MSDNEFLRQKREREFQVRVLAAVEKPKRNRLLAIINSAFFLWLMSALLLTVGGGYITNHKQCLEDADKIISRRSHLRQELFNRDLAYQRRVSEAKSFPEAFTFPDKRGSVFADLSNLSYNEVQGEYLALTNRIRYAELPDSNVSKHRAAWSDYTSLEIDKLHREIQRPLDDDNNQSPSDEARLVKSMQLNADLYVARQSFENTLDGVAYYFQPDCSAVNTTAIALGYRAPIVFAAVNPLYTMKDGSAGIIKDAIAEVEKAQNDVRSFEAEKP